MSLLLTLTESKVYPNRYLEDEDDDEETLVVTKKVKTKRSDKAFPPVSILLQYIYLFNLGSNTLVT